EVSPPVIEKGLGSIRKFLQGGVDKGKLEKAEMEKTLANIRGTTGIEDLAGCDLVIEAVSENVALKKELFGALDRACGPATIFASNTSSLSITELATFTGRPDRFVGLHFFNPVPLMKLVEVVRTLSTSDASYQAAAEWCRAM